MPELPEVETITRCLQSGGDAGFLPGAVIRDAMILWQKTLDRMTSEEFTARIKGQQVLQVGRRGKFIIIQLTQEYLLFHLRMSGDLRLQRALDDNAFPFPMEKHDRVVFNLDDDRRLVFNDARKFGRMWLVKDPAEVVGGLGPEPLSGGISAQDFYERLHLHRRRIKPLLMDQSFLAGLGNIYTDEALHLGRVHPCRLANTLVGAEAANLWSAIRLVLEEGIQRNGSSIDWVYRGGEFQNSFKVYQRTGLACFNCGQPIQRIVVGQRGTHFCPVCQPESG
jgi:formamidopyrimidine-DNA glycosylase